MRILIELGAIMLLGCGALPKPLPPPPVPADVCEAACDNAARLQCCGWRGSKGVDEQFGTDDDIACYDVCAMSLAQDASLVDLWQCVANSATVEDGEGC